MRAGYPQIILIDILPKHGALQLKHAPCSIQHVTLNPIKGLGLYPECTIFPISGSVRTSNAAVSVPIPYLVNLSILRNHVQFEGIMLANFKIRVLEARKFAFWTYY